MADDKHTAFPAHAGMNREQVETPNGLFGVPRACGDEPQGGGLAYLLMRRSPRMRG